ncbi:hypothetical protein SAMN02910456_00044 [Ruminococcaceae bacterium YRB3002]|nr:hypothetical protein SAMN02910456_00044 [Ruminococcaceae bacterium YRB3002]
MIRNVLRASSLLVASALLVSGCSLPFAKKESKVSPAKLIDACDEIDYEIYDDTGEILDEFGNERSMSNGIAARLDSKGLRKLLRDENVNEFFSFAEGMTDAVRSNKIVECAVMFRADEAQDRGDYKMFCLASGFDSDDEASEYYDAVAGFAEEYGTSAIEANVVTPSEDDLECIVYQSRGRQSAVSIELCKSLDSVMVLVGYEYFNNEVSGNLDGICSTLDIPSCGMEQWDMSEPADMGDRTECLVELYDMTEIDPGDLDALNETVEPAAKYFETDDKETMSQVLRLDDDTRYELMDRMRVGYIKRYGIDAALIFSIEASDADKAAELYDFFKMQAKSPAGDQLNVDEGIKDGINYYKFDSIFVTYRKYAIYLEGNRIYILSILGMDEQEASDQFETYSGDMELP